MLKSWKQRFKSALSGIVLGLLIPTLALGQAALLPNAKQQYLDDSGNPVSLGQVFYYIPSTSTKKTVYLDSGATTPSTNPVILDAAGRPQPTGQTFGVGSYRQKVVDANNITIWDAVTSSTGSGGGGGGSTSSIGDGMAVGTILPWSGVNSLPVNYMWTYGQTVNRLSYPDLLVALTVTQSAAVCSNGSTTLSGLTDTTRIGIGTPIEAVCITPGTTVVSKTTNSVVMSNPATGSFTTSAVFFPWGNGNGSTTFTLPALNGQIPVGRCNMGGASCALLQTYYNANPNGMGVAGGYQSSFLIQTDLPNVSLALSGTLSSVSGANVVTGGTYNNNTTLQTGATGFGVYAAGTGSSGTLTSSGSLSGGSCPGCGTASMNTGVAQTSFSNVPLSTTLDYIIKVLPDSQAKVSVIVLPASRLATTTTLPTNTYNNGSGGVGATLTATANGALSIDGITVAASDQVLIKDEAAPANNGIYTVVQTGSGSAPYVLQRLVGFDSSAEMIAGSYTLITSGVTNSTTSWVLQTSVSVVGTDPVVFNQFTSGSGVIVGSTTVSGGVATRVLYDNSGILGEYASVPVANGGTNCTVASGTCLDNITAFAALGYVKRTGPGLYVANNPIPLSDGGCNASLTASNGGIFWSNATQCQILAGTATARLPLLSGATGTPVWGAYTLPASVTSGGVACFTSTTVEASSALLSANAIVLGGGAGVCPSPMGSLGTTTTVLHGNAAGAPTFGAIVSADMNITATNCTNQFVSAISTGGIGTCTTITLASAQFANQGTTTTVLHGNAAGNPSFGAVSLTADVAGTLPLGSGGTGQTTAAAARASSGLNVDQYTGHGDSIYTILSTDRTVGTNATFTASRTWTLPAANAVNAGQEIVVADFQGTVTGTNTLVISRAGADTVNGGTSVTISAANGAYLLKSDGTSKWTAQALGAAAAGGVSSVTCGTGMSGGTITTSGTCNVSGLNTNTPYTLSTGSSASIGQNVTNYAGFGAACASGNEAVCQVPVSTPGTFKNLYVQASQTVAPGTWTVTMRKNLGATTITCTVSATTCNDTTHTFSVVAGDTVDVQIVSSATATAGAFGSFGLTLVTTSP